MYVNNGGRTQKPNMSGLTPVNPEKENGHCTTEDVFEVMLVVYTTAACYVHGIHHFDMRGHAAPHPLWLLHHHYSKNSLGIHASTLGCFRQKRVNVSYISSVFVEFCAMY